MSTITSPIVLTTDQAMATNTIDRTDPKTFQPILDLVLKGPLAPSTRDRYRRKLRVFLEWWAITGRRPLSRALVQEHLGAMKDENMPSWDIAHALTAIKALTKEAAYNGLIDAITLSGIQDIKSPQVSYSRPKNYLTEAQIKQVMALPDRSLPAGKRDYIALGMLLYCGLRRAEAVAIEFKHVRVVEGRPCFCGLPGKGGKFRDVPMPNWLFEAIQDWVDTAGITTGRILRPIARRYGGLGGGELLTANGLYRVIKRYAAKLGLDDLAPHDLRRTYGRTARRKGVDLDQIQQTYGHSSPVTTQLYIGTLDYTQAPCDALPVPD